MGDPKDLLENEVENKDNPYEIGGKNVREVMVLTDDDLVSDRPVQWSDFPFKCRKCGYPSILHFMKHCGNCGAPAIIKSRTATEFLKKMQGGY